MKLHVRTEGKKVINESVEESEYKKFPGQMADGLQFMIYKKLNKFSVKKKLR